MLSFLFLSFRILPFFILEGMMKMLKIHFICCRSFFVGDAAGRESDHSDADIKFAEVVKQF